MRAPDATVRTSRMHVHGSWQVSEDDDYNRQRDCHISEVQPQGAWSIKFSQDSSQQCPTNVDRAGSKPIFPLPLFVFVFRHFGFRVSGFGFRVSGGFGFRF
jgi:hypothetical protein